MNPENSAKAKPTYLLKFQKISGLNFFSNTQNFR